MDWDKAYRQHHGEVFRWLCWHASGNRELAADLTQDVFARAIRNEHGFRYDDGRGVAPWLMTIARNTLADHFKRHSTQRETLVAEFFDGDMVPSAETEALEALASRTVLRAVAGLNPQQREAVVLSYWGRMRDKDIAAVVGSGDKAVKLLRFRARQNLRGELAGVA